jgi:hypothetical protein
MDILVLAVQVVQVAVHLAAVVCTVWFLLVMRTWRDATTV